MMPIANPHARAEAIFTSGLDANARLVLLALDNVTARGDGASCSPSVAELATMTGLSPRSVQYAIARCVLAEALATIGRPGMRTLFCPLPVQSVRGSVSATATRGGR